MIALDEMALQSQHFTVVVFFFLLLLFLCEQTRSRPQSTATRLWALNIQLCCVLFQSNCTTVLCPTQWKRHKQKHDIPLSRAPSSQPDGGGGGGGRSRAEGAFITKHHISYHM